MTTNYKTLLPPNSSQMQRDLEESIFRATDLEVEIASLWDVDNVHETMLPYLAWSLGVEIWNDEMSDYEKRNLIRKYIVIRTLRGTKRAIELAYGLIGVTVEIIENPRPRNELGFTGGPTPFKFTLKITTQAISQKFREEIMRLTDLLKPLRTQYFIDVQIQLLSGFGLLPLKRITNVARFQARIV